MIKFLLLLVVLVPSGDVIEKPIAKMVNLELCQVVADQLNDHPKRGVRNTCTVRR